MDLPASTRCEELLRTVPWSDTGLGPPRQWPSPLRTLVSAMLASRFAMRILWGPDHLLLYNDAYAALLGPSKHPAAMGQPMSRFFPEVWEQVGPMLARVMDGETVALEDTLLPLERRGTLEECYFTLSYSPIRDEDQAVCGILGVVHETTKRVQAERRLAALLQLAEALVESKTLEDACDAASKALARHGEDVPFALFYCVDDPRREARLVASTGLTAHPGAAPPIVALDDDTSWPLGVAERTRSGLPIDDLAIRFGELHAGPFPESLSTALVLPLVRPGASLPCLFVVAGINPRCALDEQTRAFFSLLAEHVGKAVFNALACEEERRSEQALAVAAQTERQRLYERASEERYRRIVETTSDGVWMYDADGITTFVNRRMADMLGHTVDECVGKSVFDFLKTEDRAGARERLARRRQGVKDRVDVAFRRKDGATVWTSVQADVMTDSEGRFEAGLAVVVDMTAERREDETRARLAAIVESSEDAIVSTDLDGTIVTWNRGAKLLYGYTSEEVVGQSVMLLVPPSSREAERRTLEQVAAGDAVRHHETERVRRDGARVDVAVTISPILDASGVVIGLAKITRDLTARREIEATLRRTEQQFRQAQKMEAVGRLAGGLAHDFNNLLSVILSYTGMATDRLREGDPLRDDMQEIETAATRASGLTRQLLAFSRRQLLQPRVLEVKEVVSGMRGMLERLIGEDIELSCSLDPDTGRVLADRGQLEQVLMNLVVNARDAMPEGGSLTIETRNIELDQSYVGTHLGVEVGRYVLLAISDTGSGMDAVTQARVFEPFFTTKETGKGTGLGLATVFGIVKQSGGHISFYSEPDRGTTFRIYLPRTDRSEDAASPSAPARSLQGSETILLVEDEAQVRNAVGAILRGHGYQVMDASSGAEALLAAQQLAAPIHLLLTDVVLPRMSGRQVAERLASERPEMRVLFASGYTDDAIVHHGVLDAGVPFLQKPFTPDTLLRKVREVLEAPLRPLPGS